MKICEMKRKRYALAVKVMQYIGFEIPGFEKMEILELKAALIRECEQRNGKPEKHWQTRPGYHNHHIIPCHKFPLKREDPAAHVPSNLLWVTVPQHQMLHMLDWFSAPKDSAYKATVQRWGWLNDGTRKADRKREKFAPGEVELLTGIPDKPKTRKARMRAERAAAAAIVQTHQKASKQAEKRRIAALKKEDMTGYLMERAIKSISRAKYAVPIEKRLTLSGVEVSDFVYRVYASVNARLGMGDCKKLTPAERDVHRKECIARLLMDPPPNPHDKPRK